MKNQQIFRRVALERLSSPEQLDQLIRITNPKSWLSLIAIGSLLVTAVVWSLVGHIPIEVTGSAIVLNSGGVKNIVATQNGQIDSLYIEQGQIINEGDLVAKIIMAGSDEPLPIFSSYTGRILELKIDVGSLINQGTSLASLEFVGEDIAQEVIMYIPPANSQRIEPGMLVKVSPITVSVEESGFMLGQVASVSEFPITYAGMLRLLGSDDLVQIMGITGSAIEVRVALLPDPNTPSGYQWSSSTGPDFQISSGTLATASVTVDNQRPINLVLPLR